MSIKVRIIFVRALNDRSLKSQTDGNTQTATIHLLQKTRNE